MDDDEDWEFDLSVVDLKREGVEGEKEFEAIIRVGVRSRHITQEKEDHGDRPPALRIGIQYLTPPTPSNITSKSPNSPLPPPPPLRSSTPLSAISTTANSRAMSPISSQLRQATSQPLHPPPLAPTSNYFTNRTSTQSTSKLPIHFPPPPIPIPTSSSSTTSLGASIPNIPISMSGQIAHLGTSLTILEPTEFELVEENVGTTYNANDQIPKRWEATYSHILRFIALDEGLVRLGGVRVLVIDEMGEAGMKGGVGSEWETLGDVWVTG
jgi:hypothetical protein